MYSAFFMSRSFLPGTTVYQALFTVHVVSTSENRNGVSEASPAVRPANESLSTVICAAIRVFHLVVSAALSGWSETMWKTVGTVTLPLDRRGASLITPYALASFLEYSSGSWAVAPSASRAALCASAPGSHAATPGEAGAGAAVASAPEAPPDARNVAAVAVRTASRKVDLLRIGAPFDEGAVPGR